MSNQASGPTVPSRRVSLTKTKRGIGFRSRSGAMVEVRVRGPVSFQVLTARSLAVKDYDGERIGFDFAPNLKAKLVLELAYARRLADAASGAMSTT